MTLQKGHKESFARFFEEPSREGLRELLKQHVMDRHLPLGRLPRFCARSPTPTARPTKSSCIG